MNNQQSDLRRHRQKHVIQFRKQKRYQFFLKRRNIPNQNQVFTGLQENKDTVPYVIIDQRYRALILEALKKKYTKEQLPTAINNIVHPDPIIKHEAIIALRKIVSENENQETVQIIIDSGILPSLVALINSKEYPQVRFQACWVLSNVAAGTTAQCQALIDKNAVEALLGLLEENESRLNEQAIWALGNLGGDSVKFRDNILQKGGMAKLIKLVDRTNSKNVMNRAAWAISNFCRGTPLPKFQAIKAAIPILGKIICSQILPEEDLPDCLWAIANHTNQGQKTKIQKIVEINNFIPYLVQLCKKSTNNSIQVVSLRIIGNVSIGNELQTEQILKAGGLQLLSWLLNHEKKIFRRQTCWILSNISAGTSSQVAQILSNLQLLEKLKKMLVQDQMAIKTEIAYIFKNLCSSAHKEKIMQIVIRCNIVEGISALINQDEDNSAILAGLKCLFQLLNLGSQISGQNLILKQLQMIPGCLERLQSLQHHKSPEVYNQVVKIFKNFFILEEEML